MKQQLTLPDLALELQRIKTNSKDYIADTRAIRMRADMQTVAFSLVNSLTLRPYAHGQLAELCEIPKPFYDRSRTDFPAETADLVNAILHKLAQPRMVRTVGTEVRAILSNKYRPIDNFDVAEAVLPELFKFPELRVEACALTEARMYINVVFPRIEARIAEVGDVVQLGLSCRNSDVGAGAFEVAPIIYTLRCKNGMVCASEGKRRAHVGKRNDEDSWMYSAETRAADDKAFFLKVRDTVRATLTQATFDRLVEKLNVAATDRIATDADIPETVMVLGERYGLTKETQTGILTHLINGGDLSRYGYLNAVTAQAQDEEDYELGATLERLGGQILEMPRVEFQRLAA